ncbi:MAG TPA: hypothetical protein PLE35_07530, partial [Lentisphaeria bacterium]|nr:hypothetical protein [Lentisphaeria bacterium]
MPFLVSTEKHLANAPRKPRFTMITRCFTTHAHARTTRRRAKALRHVVAMVIAMGCARGNAADAPVPPPAPALSASLPPPTTGQVMLTLN